MDMQRTDLSHEPHIGSQLESRLESQADPRSSRLRRLGAFAALMLTMVFYQNFNFAQAWKVNLIPLNEQARANHARELLGKYYFGSPAHRVETAKSLGMAIFNDVYANLPKKFKKRAVSLSSTILKEAEKYSIDPVFVIAVIKTESSFNPLARGGYGEIGLMQLKPDTAKWIASKYKIPYRGKKSLKNPATNVRIGIAYLDYLRNRFDGHANKYLSAYNMGPYRVARMYQSERKPKEYSLRVMKNYRETYSKLAAVTTVNLLAGY